MIKFLHHMKNIYECEHGRTIFQDCVECEKLWLEKRIAKLESLLARRRLELAKLKPARNQNKLTRKL